MNYMALTHHPVRLFRLSCGCLRTFPMMPVGPEHTVLCVSCAVAAVTEVVYPEGRCSVPGWATVAGRRFRVSCTLEVPHYDAHYDELLRTGFTGTEPRLTAMREGRTGRA